MPKELFILLVIVGCVGVAIGLYFALRFWDGDAF